SLTGRAEEISGASSRSSLARRPGGRRHAAPRSSAPRPIPCLPLTRGRAATLRWAGAARGRFPGPRRHAGRFARCGSRRRCPRQHLRRRRVGVSPRRTFLEVVRPVVELVEEVPELMGNFREYLLLHENRDAALGRHDDIRRPRRGWLMAIVASLPRRRDVARGVLRDAAVARLAAWRPEFGKRRKIRSRSHPPRHSVLACAGNPANGMLPLKTAKLQARIGHRRESMAFSRSPAMPTLNPLDPAGGPR